MRLQHSDICNTRDNCVVSRPCLLGDFFTSNLYQTSLSVLRTESPTWKILILHVYEAMALYQVFLLMLALIREANTEYCNKTSDTLSFSTDLNGDEDVVRRGSYEKITCCANNFVGDVEWSHYKNGTLVKFPPPNDNDPYTFTERGQILNIRNVRMRDNGTFVCTARNGSQSVTFQMKLYVKECRRAAGKVLPLKVPKPKEYTSVGSRLVLQCIGDFGCDMKSLRSVFWFMSSETLDGETSFFKVRTINKRDGIFGKELIFKEVTADNFTTNYTCLIAGVPPNNSNFFPVVLEEEPTTQEFPFLLETVLGTLAAVALVAGLVVGVRYQYGYQVKYWINSKLNIGWPKDCGDKKIGLVSAGESRAFVSEHIADYLIREQFDVYYHHDSPDNDGRPEATAHLEELQRCSHVIMFLSEEEGQERFSSFFIESVLRTRNASRVLIIHKGNINRVLKTFDDDTSSLLQVVKKFEYPEQSLENGRKMKNFWCSVKLCLPAVRETSANVTHVHQNHERHSSSSSSSALLSDIA